MNLAKLAMINYKQNKSPFVFINRVISNAFFYCDLICLQTF